VLGIRGGCEKRRARAHATVFEPLGDLELVEPLRDRDANPLARRQATEPPQELGRREVVDQQVLAGRDANERPGDREQDPEPPPIVREAGVDEERGLLGVRGLGGQDDRHGLAVAIG
jgi:hypothetical protein